MYENETYSNTDNGGYTTYQTNGNPYSSNNENNEKNGKKEKKKGGFRKVAFSMTLGLAFGACAGAGFYGVQYGFGRLPQNESRDAALIEGGNSSGASGETGLPNVSYVTYVKDDISDVVEEVMPAMVSIVNNYTVTGMTIWGQTYNREYEGSGSGIIVAENDNEFLIVTNNHVVDGATTLTIFFIDGSTAEAVIKGVDSEMDLAVISVPRDSLSEETRDAICIAKLGDSESLRLGTPVIAIGNALGIGQSVTSGIISALNREMSAQDGTSGIYIQTDAAINHGNSGGALLNINGEVIGINSARIDDSSTESVEGMGYAIPISSASPIIADLMERRSELVAEEEKGYLGITMQEVTSQVKEIMRSYVGVEMPNGVGVAELAEGSPAEKAGMQVLDVIVKFDGRKISSITDIHDAMRYYRAGETIVITVERNIDGEYQEIELEVTLGQRPQEN